MWAGLQCIDDSADYEVSLAVDFSLAPRRRLSGRELRQLQITIDDMPGAVLLEWRRVVG